MNQNQRKPDFKFTYRSMGIGALIGVGTYAAFRNHPSISEIVRYGTWLAIVPVSLLLIAFATFFGSKLSDSRKSLLADIWLEFAKVLVGHGLVFCTLCFLRPF